MRKRFKRRRKNKFLKILIFLAVFAIIIYIFLNMFYVARKTIRTYAQSEMEQIAGEAIHSAVRDASKEGVGYTELVNIYRGENGKIESLTLNYANANILKSDIALKTLEYLNEKQKVGISIPLGNLTGSDLLSGLGPKIKIRIVPNSIADIDFESSFNQSGINQVRHSISARVTVYITALLADFSEISSISTSAVISEAVIIGDVPDTYLNIGGNNK